MAKIDPPFKNEIGANGYGKKYQYPLTDKEQGFSGGYVLAKNSNHGFRGKVRGERKKVKD